MRDWVVVPIGILSLPAGCNCPAILSGDRQSPEGDASFQALTGETICRQNGAPG